MLQNFMSFLRESVKRGLEDQVELTWCYQLNYEAAKADNILIG